MNRLNRMDNDVKVGLLEKLLIEKGVRTVSFRDSRVESLEFQEWEVKGQRRVASVSNKLNDFLQKTALAPKQATVTESLDVNIEF